MYQYAYENLSLSDMDGEIWKDIKGFEECYMVSNLGRIKSLGRMLQTTYRNRKIPTRIRKQQSFKGETPKVGLYIDGKMVSVFVSRIVYSTFISPLPYSESQSLVVSHKNNDKKDNRVDNLFLINRNEFCQNLYNSGISLPAHLKKVSAEGREKIRQACCKVVSQYTGKGEFVRSYKSITEAAEATGASHTSISACIAGRYKSAAGFIWAFGNNKILSEKRIKEFQKASHKLRPVVQYDQDNNPVKVYCSTAEAARVIGINRRSLCSYLTKKGKVLHNGYIWCFD